MSLVIRVSGLTARPFYFNRSAPTAKISQREFATTFNSERLATVTAIRLARKMPTASVATVKLYARRKAA